MSLQKPERSTLNDKEYSGWTSLNFKRWKTMFFATYLGKGGVDLYVIKELHEKNGDSQLI